jgi:hypothetical protein
LNSLLRERERGQYLTVVYSVEGLGQEEGCRREERAVWGLGAGCWGGLLDSSTDLFRHRSE